MASLSKQITEALLPIRHAEAFTRGFLYWLPAAAFPLPAGDKTWITELIRLITAHQVSQKKGEPEVFIRQDTILQSFCDQFMSEVLELRPLLGFPRSPGQKLKNRVTDKEIAEFREGKEFDLDKYMDYWCYWLIGGDRTSVISRYFGAGGMAVIWLKDAAPAPQTAKVPKFLAKDPGIAKVLKRFPLDEQLRGAAALKHPFLAKSVEFFGKDLSPVKTIENIPFVLPRLAAADFFGQPEEYVKQLFELVEIYLIESPVDNGVLLASATDLSEPLVAALAELRKAGLVR